MKYPSLYQPGHTHGHISVMLYSHLQTYVRVLEKKKWLHHILCVNISHLDFLAHLVAEVAESPTNFRPSFSLSFALQGTWLIL